MLIELSGVSRNEQPTDHILPLRHMRPPARQLSRHSLEYNAIFSVQRSDRRFPAIRRRSAQQHISKRVSPHESRGPHSIELTYRPVTAGHLLHHPNSVNPRFRRQRPVPRTLPVVKKKCRTSWSLHALASSSVLELAASAPTCSSRHAQRTLAPNRSPLPSYGTGAGVS